jgi:FixJ family two-component response regulator
VLLRRLYRLTEAEAEVALHLMHGADLKQISEELSVWPAAQRQVMGRPRKTA